MSKQNINKYRYILSVVRAMNIDSTKFVKNLANGCIYETTLYGWIVVLFEKGINTERAVNTIIYKRMLQSDQHYHSLHEKLGGSLLTRQYQKALEILSTNPIYNRLDVSNKNFINGKVKGFISTRLYTYLRVVELILDIIKSELQHKKSNNNSIWMEHPKKTIKIG